jgi:hypothetical protein
MKSSKNNISKDVNEGAKKMAKNGRKMAIYKLYISSFFSCKVENKRKGKKIVIYDVAFDPIKILTCWMLQNDCQNLSFVKAFNVVGKKKARNTCKMADS